MRQRILVMGASRGIGGFVARSLVAAGHEVLSVSRTPAEAGQWIAADVTTDVGIDDVVAAVGPGPLDALLYLGGIWEQGAFGGGYRFLASSRAEVRQVLAVNLTAPILLVQALAPMLAQSRAPRVVLMGSLSGTEGGATVEVANTASKFGLRGAAKALRLALKDDGVSITVINPGNVATPEVLDDIAQGRTSPQYLVALTDITRLIDYLLTCEVGTAPLDIDLGQRGV